MLNAQEKEVYARTVARERLARMDAEKLLEEKSNALYCLNTDLEKTLALHRREAFYLQSVLDSAMDGILTISLDGIIDTANVSAGRIFNTTPADLKGRNAIELIVTETKDLPTRANRYFSDICNERRPTIEATGLRNDGSRIELELSASYGEVDGDAVVIWVLRDISCLRTIKRQSDLNERMAGIGQLAAGIAHEINTPIQFVHENTKFFNDAFKAIDETLKLYEQHCSLTPDLKSEIEKVCPASQLQFFRGEIETALSETLAGTQRIAKIVSAVKEFSHPGSAEKVLIDLNRAIESAATVTTNHWKLVADVDFHLNSDVPRLKCLPSQVSQVLVNLIVNAADAIQDQNKKIGRKRGSIVLSTGFDSDSIFFSVEDTGTGIDQENLQKIFLPFFTTKPVGKGTGQGLSITHSIIVENHGGRVDVKSDVGVGTSFTVHFPRS